MLLSLQSSILHASAGVHRHVLPLHMTSLRSLKRRIQGHAFLGLAAA